MKGVNIQAKEPKGLAQMVVTNIVVHLASFVLAGTQFKSPLNDALLSQNLAP